MGSKEKRCAVVSLHKEGKSASFIAKTLSVPRQTVYDAINRFEEIGGTQDRPKSGRPATACTSANQKKIRERIRRKSQQSMRAMAKSLGISDFSVRKIVKKQLGLQPYKFQTAQLLTEEHKTKRLQKARKMLRLGGHGRVLFTDEKIFTVERFHNHQNDRQLLPKGSGMSLLSSSLNINAFYSARSRFAETFPSVSHGLGRNHRNWQDPARFCRKRCQD